MEGIHLYVSGPPSWSWKALILYSAKNDCPAEADQIIGIIVAQLNLSPQHGYAWSRWNRIVSTKLPKSAGNMLLHKLRTIHLFEADFNWCQGLVIGRRMIKESEIKNRLHQTGSSRSGSRLSQSNVLRDIPPHSDTPWIV